MTASTLDQLLEEMGSDDLKHLLEDSTLVSDQMGRRLIKKAAGPNSPISVTELPLDGLPRDAALHRLYTLEGLGIFKSTMAEKGDSLVRQFQITEVGKKLASLFG